MKNNNVHFLIPLIYVMTSALSGNSLINIIFLLYCVTYILMHKWHESLYFILMLIPLMDIMVYKGVPLLNLLIVVIFISYLSQSKSFKNLNSRKLFLFMIIIIYDFTHYLFYPIKSYVELSGTIIWAICFLFFSILVTSNNKEFYSEYGQKCFIIGTGYSILYGYVERFRSTGLLNLFTMTGVTDRSYGASGDPNYYSLYILLSIVFMIDLSRRSNKKYTMTLLFIFIYGFSGLLSLSRMYIIILVFIIVCYLSMLVFNIIKHTFTVKHEFEKVNFRKISKVITTIFVVTILNFSFQSLVSQNVDVILKRFKYNNIETLTSNRNIILRDYIDYIFSSQEKLFFGIGVVKYNLRSGILAFAHNMYFEILIAWGIAGISYILILILILTVDSIYINSGKIKLDGVKLLPILVLGIAGFSVNILEIESFYILIFLCLSLLKNNKVNNLDNQTF